MSSANAADLPNLHPLSTPLWQPKDHPGTSSRRDSRRWPGLCENRDYEAGSFANTRRPPIRTTATRSMKTGSNQLSRPTAKRGLGGRHHVCANGRGMALPRQHDGLVHPQNRGVACGLADDQGACAPGPGDGHSA